MKVRLVRRALEDARKAIVWWRANREVAPQLLEEELRWAQETLARTPFAGTA